MKRMVALIVVAIAACGGGSRDRTLGGPDAALPAPDAGPLDAALPTPDGAPPDAAMPLLAVSLTGVGSITSSPVQLACPPTCSGAFPTNTNIELTATGKLIAWGAGPCSGAGATCDFALTGDTTRAAAFYAAGSFTTATTASAPDTAALDPTTAITVEAWIQFTGTPATDGASIFAVSKGDPFGSSGGYSLGYHSQGGGSVSAQWAAHDGGSLVGCDSGVLSPGLHDLAGEYDGATGNLELYVDGVPVCGGTLNVGALDASTAPLTFGSSAFAGTIDEVRISRVARYGQQSFTPERHPAADGNTVGLWHFDEGAGTTISDALGASNATIGGTGFIWIAEP